MYKITSRDYLERANKHMKRAHRALAEMNEALDHQDLRSALRLAEEYGGAVAEMSEAIHMSQSGSGIRDTRAVEIQTWHDKTLRELGDYWRATLDRLPVLTKRANGRVAAGRAQGRKR